MKAMILAAGFGTRLWPLTIGRTKPAIPFLNRPLIAFTIDYLRNFGITDIIVNLHHEPESVRSQIGDGSDMGVSITYSVEEPEILGTSGALDRVRELLLDDTFVVVNGKIVTNLDLESAIRNHRASGAIGTLVLRENQRCEGYSRILVDQDGCYQGFGPFPKAGEDGPAPLMFTGIHILEPGIFSYIPRGVFSDSIRDVYPAAMQDGQRIGAAVVEGYWYELSTLRRYLDISLEFAARNGSTVIKDPSAEIEAGADVESCVLWPGAKICKGAKARRCVLGDDVVLSAGADYSDSIIVKRDLVEGHPPPEKAASGKVIDDLYVVAIP